MEIWKIYVDLIWTPTVLLHSNERSFSTAELLTYEATDLGSQRKFKIVSISILKCYPAHLPALHINEDHGFVFLPPLVKAEQVDSFQIRDAEKDIINWPAIDFSAVPRRSYKTSWVEKQLIFRHENVQPVLWSILFEPEDDVLLLHPLASCHLQHIANMTYITCFSWW